MFEHAQNTNGQGENLGLQCGSGSDADLVRRVVDAWYKEVCLYNFNYPRFDSRTGHFTQVVWKRSTSLGIGFARGSYTFNGKRFANCLFVVGRYREHGNVTGAFPQNVVRGRFNYQATCRQRKISLYRKRNKLFANLKGGKNKDEPNVKLQLVL